MIPNYPATLPCPSAIDVTPAERRFLATERYPTHVETFERQRRTFERVTWPWMTAEQAALWDAWWTTDLGYGGSWFKASWPSMRGAIPTDRHFIETPAWTFRAGGFWQVTALIETRARGSVPDYGEPPLVMAWDVDLSSIRVTFSDSDLRAQAIVKAGVYVNAIANVGAGSGKRYFELTIEEIVGFAGAWPAFGIVTGDYWASETNPTENAPIIEIGSQQWGLRSSGDVATGSVGIPPLFFSAALTGGDIVGVAADLDGGKLYFSRNGTFEEGQDPGAGTGAPYDDLLTKSPFPVSGTNLAFPSFSCDGNNNPTGRVLAHFSSDSWTYSPPSGYVAWDA